MAKKSDYNLPFTNAFELLPDVLRSQTNDAVFEDVFNRYLSKPQLELVDGFVGAPLSGDVQNRQVQEPTPHRQAFQLQPLLYAKLGTQNHIASYEDTLNELERTGISACRLPLWGNALQFNWAPPIDIDKLVNFRDYYWVDVDDPTSDPQYITIESPCREAQQRVDAYQVTLDEFGEEFEIVALSTTNKTITIDADADITPVFTEGFVFYVQNSTNGSIDDTFFTTVSSVYNTDGTTTITVAETLSSATPVDGEVSIGQFMLVLQSGAACACGGDVGWDSAPWDDNQLGSVLWAEGLLDLISWDTQAEWEAANGLPAVLDIWFDTDANQLKQYDGSDWVVVQNNFRVIVNALTGTHFWDYTSTCDVDTNPWTEQNLWVHKNHVTNLGVAQRAEMPIIEYDFGVQLNEWSFVNYIWKYRESDAFTFESTDDKPTLNELIPFKYIIAPSSPLDTVVLSPEYGDRTADFAVGSTFRVRGDTVDTDNNGIYTVAAVTFSTTSVADGISTVITTEETFSSAGQSETVSVFSPIIQGSGGEIIPVLTSQGDVFQSYHEHWVLVDEEQLPVPAPVQDEHSYVDIDVTSPPTLYVGIGTYTISTPINLLQTFNVDPYNYTIEYLVDPTQAPLGVTSGTPFPLKSDSTSRMDLLARVGANDVRVWVDDVQQFGTFDEVDTDADGFVDQITFTFTIDPTQTVRISVGESALSDVGRSSISVRTEEDDDLFAASPQPFEERSLIEYRRTEQIKTDTNQYPLFDMFTCFGEPLYQASSLFAYKEDSSEDINALIGRRIVGTTTDDFAFQNFLIDPDTLPRPTLYAYMLDDELQTVWRKGLNDEEYVPSYVDEDKNPVAVNSEEGAWEVPNQLYYNAEHENREFVTFPELITHFRSIVAEQSALPGFIVPGNHTYLLEEVNLGLGGRIKEHNDSYDTFLSSTFVDNVTPLGIIDFAHDQYENSLNTIEELYRRNVLSFLISPSPQSINDFQGTVTNYVINQYELNDFYAVVYGDSNTFIVGSPELGIKNWPATLPFIGMAMKQQPYIIEDDTLDVRQLVHHDGHRSEPRLSQTTVESIIQQALITTDSDGAIGTQQTTTRPSLYSALEAVIEPRAGILWYHVAAGVRVLYRFAVSGVGPSFPTGVPVGALWYDTDADLLMELQSTLLWTPVYPGSPQEGLIDAAWEEIDLDDVLLNLLLEVETRLYEAAPTLTEVRFDVEDALTSDVSCSVEDSTQTEAETGELYYEEQFGTYLRAVEVDDPYSADQFFDLADPFTWNYYYSLLAGTVPNNTFTSGQTNIAGWWLDLYLQIYGTPYPHLEPWILQGYRTKPSWWDDEYLETDGSRRWIYDHSTTTGMWQQIRLGRVPAGELLADGVTVSTGANGEAQTWNFFSVNIDDVAVDGFDPDDIFPPFWDHVANGYSLLSTVRSVYHDFASLIVQPSADYSFESGGPFVYEWKISSQRLYDDLSVGYRMQPVRFMHYTFGVNFHDVGGLQVDENCKVYSHRDVQFHGDIYNTNQILVVEGMNQWYVNFNRFNGYDISSSSFRPLWSSWQPHLAYQFGSVIDTQTFGITNSNFDITERDYQILLKRSPGIDDHYLDAFNVTVLESPNKLIQFETEQLWKFQIDTFFPTAREITYHEVHNYPVRADSITSEFNLYEYVIADVDVSADMFMLDGDQTEAFTISQAFTVAGSTGNDGSYTATNVTFNPVTNQTVITVASVVDPTVDGYLVASYRTHPWATGDLIELTSTSTVPAPLAANREYFVIKIDDTTFQLAATASDAALGNNIVLTNAGSGLVRAGQIQSKFVALDGAASTRRVWTHYAIDDRFTRSFVTPHRVTGVQTMINLVDGYAVAVENEGWIINLDSYELDSDTEKPVSWRVEIDRFLDQIFRLPQQRAAVPSVYPVTVDPVGDTFTFGSNIPNWTTGTRVQFSALSDLLPTPIVANQTYFVIRIDDQTIQVALTAADALLGTTLNILTAGSASVGVFEPPTRTTRHPQVEINPFRNNVWLETPRGVLSNVVDGPTADIRNTQLVADQYGNQLTEEEISVFRWDRFARVYVPSPVPNPNTPVGQETPYNTLHMASMHAFVDGYEHVILFNDYSVEDILIYDPFVGLNTARFFTQYFRQDEFTQRPVVGGYFLTGGDEILRNIEAGVLDLQKLYDTYTVLETTPMIREGRKTLGYQPASMSFLDQLGLNAKSKFLFWRGMIQNKGSVNAINAFTNSSKFEDAIVDEYWAYKVGEFGSNYEQEYPALNLFIDDSRRSEKRFEFLELGDLASDTFEGVNVANEDRWHNQPDVFDQLSNNGSTMYFDAHITNVQAFTTATLGASGSGYFVESTVPFDDVVILRVNKVLNTVSSMLTEGIGYTVVNSKLIRFPTNPALALGANEEYRMYTINPAHDKLNPSKVIDIKAGIVINEVPIWDPIRGQQYAYANNVVNLENSSDPASYTTSLDSTKVDSQFWNTTEVGRVWWDTSQRGYVPYNDHTIFALDDRVQAWGKLADWSEIKLYQWTKSDIAPSEWDAVAAVEELNASIDPQIRKTGRVKVETFQRERAFLNVVTKTGEVQGVFPSTATDGTPNTITVSDVGNTLQVGDRVVFTTDDELPAPLQSGEFYFIVDIVEIAGSPQQREISVSLEEDGDILEITPGPMLVDIASGTSDPRIDSNPTYLINDFDTSGYQDVLLSASKTLNSATGLSLGTAGYQDVTFPTAISPATLTGLPSGTDNTSVSNIVYTGYVDATASSPVLPDGWSVSHGATGVYTVTHNLNLSSPETSQLVVVVTPHAASTATSSYAAYVESDTFGANSFTVLLAREDEAGQDGAFMFTAVPTTGNSPTVTAQITADDEPTAQTVEVSFDTAPTFSALVTELNAQLDGITVSFAPDGFSLRFTSDSGGDTSTVTIEDVDLFSSMAAAGGSPGDGEIQTHVFGASVTYQTTIAVDGGGEQNITISGDQAQTYQDLFSALSISGATTSLVTNAIRIRSRSSGAQSSVDINEVGSPGPAALFASLTDFAGFDTPVDGVDATRYTLQVRVGATVKTAKVIANQAQNWDDLLVLANQQLGGLLTVTSTGDILVSSGNNTITMLNTELFDHLGEEFASPAALVTGYTPLNTGEGNHQVVPPFRDTDWVQLADIKKELIGRRDNAGSNNYNLAVSGTAPNNIQAGDVVDVYVNGTLFEEDVVVGTSGTTNIPGIGSEDFITVRKAKHVLTDDERAFDPDVSDDGTRLIQYTEDYNYSQTQAINDFGNPVPVYYFWVENKTVRQGNDMSLRQAALELETIPTPFMIFDNLLDEETGGSPTAVVLPRRYNQLILRGLAGVVDDADRYVLRFTRDFTLRDALVPRNYTTDLPADFSRVGQEPLDLKTLHTEWTLIREKQPFNVPRALWNKVTESIIARSLDDPGERVPTLARELYDLSHGTDTRYGLQDGQAFVNGVLALATILDDLEDPNNNFFPIDVNSFFEDHDFETEEGIIEAMDDIYNTFSFESVNRMWFKVLLDAHTTKQQFADVFKTSWVSLSGTQLLITEDLYSG